MSLAPATVPPKTNKPGYNISTCHHQIRVRVFTPCAQWVDSSAFSHKWVSLAPPPRTGLAAHWPSRRAGQSPDSPAPNVDDDGLTTWRTKPPSSEADDFGAATILPSVEDDSRAVDKPVLSVSARPLFTASVWGVCRCTVLYSIGSHPHAWSSWHAPRRQLTTDPGIKGFFEDTFVNTYILR